MVLGPDVLLPRTVAVLAADVGQLGSGLLAEVAGLVGKELARVPAHHVATDAFGIVFPRGPAFFSVAKAREWGDFFQTRYDSSWQFLQASVPTKSPLND